MDIVGRLAEIQEEIQTAETEKLQKENWLGLLWEHLPALDPEVVGRVMQRIRDRIRALENRKEALLQEHQSLLVEGAISNLHIDQTFGLWNYNCWMVWT
ncbi:hypothetical protein TanjilG_25092 [Lupinus angustifolius]|uniref:Uncharacterized protein n=1 Tax=Lupinus angustifolius TaxID=3871 RepID=A0A1J7GN47_LUPAN|nr:hypothetical protein TanjilG_25092 [Lupinus angustifolius]